MSKDTVWGKRFAERAENKAFEALNSSIETDVRLYREEIAATAAHARALKRAGIYTDAELGAVLSALSEIEKEIAAGECDILRYEDVHTLVEKMLTDKTGKAGMKIQTARSRNEQTITNQRLFLKKKIAEIDGLLHLLQAALLKAAECGVDALIPGYTHARPAQPIRAAHYFLAHFFGLERDRERFAGALMRVDQSSAGTGPLAGATFGLDRDALAEDLGFAAVLDNALDAVSDRDTHMETLAAAAIMQVRLSRMAADLIAWSAPECGFMTLGDSCCTSSSIMPQKKNPDGLELVRAKAARTIGDLCAMLAVCKGLPTGYQKDLQEDKACLFGALDSAALCLETTRSAVEELKLNAEAALGAIPAECMATDLADALVSEGVPFREAYGIIAAEIGRAGGLADFGRRIPSPEESVERRDSVGGTARKAVLGQMEKAKEILQKHGK
jgi:argininosuccinate lyase